MSVAEIIDFNEVEHRYVIDGREVPSVTTILKDAGLVDYTFCSEFARERGSNVHKAIHYALEGDLDETTLHESLQGYVAAARKCIADLRLEVKAIEARVYSKTYRYAGTLDLLVKLDGKLILIDWKTGEPPAATALQLAAYAHAWFEQNGEYVTKRYAVRLRSDGTYTLHPYTNRSDLNTFTGAVAVAAWKGMNA